MEKEIVKLGVVGVDSGQLVICDPQYIESQYQNPDSEGKSDHAHTIYKHKDGKYWQFCYGEKPSYENVNSFTGTYADIIPEYKLSPNQMIQKGLFEETKLDTSPHIPNAEFSYRGICKITNNSENLGGQLNYLMGHAGVAVAFHSGLGDGTYDVFAEIVDAGEFGRRIKRVYVEFITDKELEELNNPTFHNN